MSEPPAAPVVFPRRQKLRDLELIIRQEWEEAKLYEAEIDPSKETFFACFPYPYMNGKLHLGHAFTITKADFSVAYQRLKGKNVLFPFAFHVTGMPISAAANKIKNEMEKFGNPPNQEKVEALEAESKAKVSNDSPDINAIGNFKSKKTKTVRKTGKKKLQWDILKDMGLKDEEIPEFSNPLKWCDYFPSLGEEDLKLFGIHTDWRRSFVTASQNPFYDQFIRWQFLKLKENNCIDFGRRATIYSTIDKQACADHDRSSGEGVGPQEYTLIKLRVLELPKNVTDTSPKLLDAIDNGKLFMVAATLRPETMYGQTNCFVLPSGEYGAYEFNVEITPGSKERENQILICSKRSATNMSYQDPFALPEDWGKLNLITTIKGKELVGCPVKAPKAAYDKVYCLPLLSISMNKGTGVVTSVPSDSPDDYAALRDWQNDAKLREKHNVTEDMVAPYQIIPIINIPGMGDTSAVFMCDKLKIKSQNDKKKLEEAKAETYKEGFYKGVMLVGEADNVKGLKVADAKDICKVKMCEDGEAFIYYEPEKEIISRSGGECVVAYLDQWFIKYGEANWAEKVRNHVTDPSKFETYTGTTRKAFTDVIDWLKEWACSRNFGLGTVVPWDEQFVIESLSDSTIYMAYYTISHLLQGRKDARDYTGDNGKGSPLGIKPEQMTPNVFDYIFLKKEYPEGCGIEQASLDKMRNSFEYWYPFNLRVSGRDLIQNHLTMALYNHASIWKDQPEMMPKSFFCNGFVEVDGAKMAKSEGNFITLKEAIVGHRATSINGKKVFIGWSADSTRLSLADAGDGLDGANFSCDTADKAILRLTTELEWIEEVFAIKQDLRNDTNYNFWDRAFDSEMNMAVIKTDKAYEGMRFRDVTKHGFFEFTGFRDRYRDACTRADIPMNFALITKYIEFSAIIMSPICPYFYDHIWRKVLGKKTFLYHAEWPKVDMPDLNFLRSVEFLHDVCRDVRLSIASEMKRRTKKKITDEVKHVTIHISTTYPDYLAELLKFLDSRCDKNSFTFPKDIMKQLKELCSSNPDLKKAMKQCLQKAAFIVQTISTEKNLVALELGVPFDQEKILTEQKEFCEDAMGIPFTIKYADSNSDKAAPGKPHYECE